MPSKKAKGNEGRGKHNSRTPRRKENTEVLPESSKRKFFPSPSSEERSKKQVKKTIDGRIIDSYCWICHELAEEEVCSACGRVFHSSCLSKKMNFKDEICPECQSKTIDGSDLLYLLSQDKLQRLLSYVVTQVYKSVKVPSCLWRWPNTEENNKLKQVIDGEILIDKLNMDKTYYKSVASFYSDVKFILHNSHILYGANSNEVQGAKRLLKRFRAELLDIEACPECYENKISEVRYLPDFFSRVCKQPHTIIWAKLKGFPYWPAKSLKVVDDIVDVRFFGTHDKAFVPVNNCFLISEKYPTPKTPKQSKFQEAMSELKEYVSRYSKQVGSFQFAEGKLAYKPENVDCDLSETAEMDERDDSLTVNGNDVVDNTLLLTASENDLPEDLLDINEAKSANHPSRNRKANQQGETTLSGGLLDANKEAEFPTLQMPALTFPTVTDVFNSSSSISTNLDQLIEKEVDNRTFTPVSVSMTFSTDDEVQRSCENSYRNNATLLNVSPTTICTTSPTVQNDGKGNQTISVLDHLSNNEAALIPTPVVAGSKSLALPDPYIDQSYINFLNREAQKEFANLYGVDYRNFSQSQIAQNLQPTRCNWNFGSGSNAIYEQGMNSGSNTLTLCDNTLLSNTNSLGNYSQCGITSNVNESMPINNNQAELSIAPLCANADQSHQANASNQDGDQAEVEFLCETRGTVANIRRRNLNVNLLSATERHLFNAMVSADPKVQLLVNEHSARMEQFLINAFQLIKALPEGGAIISRLYSQNVYLKKQLSQMILCLKYLERRFKERITLSAERAFNAARVVKGFHIRSTRVSVNKCELVYHDFSTKMKEREESMEKEFNERLVSYEKLVQSLEDDKHRLKSQNEKLLEEVENSKTDIRNLESKCKTLLEEIENIKVGKKTVELQNEVLLKLVENFKINQKKEINAIVKEKIDTERLKWEQSKNEEVMEAKRADWCNVCLKSASIHCCWNTNYCSDHCRQKHHEKHSRVCLNEENKKAPPTSTASAEGPQDFTHRSNIQRSVTLMSSSANHTSVVQAREFMFATNSVTVPHEPTSPFIQGRKSSPLLPTPKKGRVKTLGVSRKKERK